MSKKLEDLKIVLAAPTQAAKIYEYKNCDKCQKALKFLKSREIDFFSLSIVEQPPSLAELKKMLGYLKQSGGSFKNLFNTSGAQYRDLRVGEKIKAGLTEDEALRLLAAHGKLIKRPFLLTRDGGTVGFNPEAWSKIFKT